MSGPSAGALDELEPWGDDVDVSEAIRRRGPSEVSLPARRPFHARERQLVAAAGPLPRTAQRVAVDPPRLERRRRTLCAEPARHALVVELVRVAQRVAT